MFVMNLLHANQRIAVRRCKHSSPVGPAVPGRAEGNTAVRAEQERQPPRHEQLVITQPTQRSPTRQRSSTPTPTPGPPRPPCQPSRRSLLLGLAGTALLGAVPLDKALAAEGITTVFVAGATGRTGRRVVQALRRAGYGVRAGVRDTGKALALGFGADAGIEIVEADVTKGLDALAAAIGGAQAVICATGSRGFGPNGSQAVDEQGTMRLVDAAAQQGVSRFVLVTSLLTNGAAAGQGSNPNYIFLNFFGGILDAKLRAELYLRSSGLDYTIIRPGGLSDEPEAVVGPPLLRPEDSLFGLDTDPSRALSRDSLAALAVGALASPAASRAVVEAVGSPAAPARSVEALFEGLRGSLST